MKYLIITGGIYHLICALFHIAFPRLFKWNLLIKDINQTDKNYLKDIIYTSNSLIGLIWLMFAALSLFKTDELISTRLGNFILFIFTGIWFVRIFILFPIYTGFRSIFSLLRFIFFIIGFILYLISSLLAVYNY